MQYLGITHSVCGRDGCRRLVPARVEADGDGVFFRKLCPEHGESRCLVRSDPAGYLAAQRIAKPAWEPLEFPGDERAGCPDGCGFCSRHEQHLCLPIVEITSRCDLSCPICIADAGGGGSGPARTGDMTPAGFERLLDGLVRAERQIDVLNLSGGEPLLHPDFLAFVDAALSRPEVVRVSVSTNGLALLERPELLREIKARNVVVSLQFDGFRDEIYERLRGRRLLAEKLRVLDALGGADAATSLTMTAATGVNDDQFPRMLETLFSRSHVISLMVQPLAFAGRAAEIKGPDPFIAKERNNKAIRNQAPRRPRLTIPDVVRLLGEARHPAVRAEDFVPLPCSHPLCFSLAYYLVPDDGGSISVNRLVDAATIMDTVANRTVFGLDAGDHQKLKELVYSLWSGPAASSPDCGAVLETVRALLRQVSGPAAGGEGRRLCSCFDPRRAFTLAERRVKSVFIHAFQDAETFDLARARRCCNGYPQSDGRVIPACVHNVLRRGAQT